ncbi:hypothetical protein V6N11_020063 [Hibiscus sabdariffa]|uniref:DUF7780 domain-containing protein n=1 Tax=Hibiscus sabdariffa TaxID=183260 RepID=A0ABR2P8I5_9ROSI
MLGHKPLQRLKTPAASFALQGMGTLYRRGTKAMNDLVVGHVIEDVTEDDLRLFLRVLHRSGVTSRADAVFLFGSSSLSSRFSFVIQEENDSFFKLVRHYNGSSGKGLRDSVLSFDSTQFWKSGKKEVKETVWGKKGRGSYKLAGWVPGSRSDESEKMGLLSDAIRNRSPESVYILTKESSSGKHSKRNSEKTQSHHHLVNSGILMGGARGIRRLSNAMLTEIVRATMQHRKKSSVSESGVLSQLVGNGHIPKNVNLITSTESIQDASSLMGLSPNSASDYSIIQRAHALAKQSIARSNEFVWVAEV